MPGPFLDRAIPPTRADLVAALGPALSVWDRIAERIGSDYGVAGEPWFFGRESGWVERYRRGGKALVVLLPERAAFSAIVVLGPSVLPTALALPLDPAVLGAVEAAHDYPEGRWARVPVTTEAIADDVVRLVALKSPAPRRPRGLSRATPATRGA